MLFANTPTRSHNLAVQTPDKEAIDDLIGKLAISEGGLRSDFTMRPDSASLADYEATPIAGFGTALIEGLGWKVGDIVGQRKGRVIEPLRLRPRPALLGIGGHNSQVGPRLLLVEVKIPRDCSQELLRTI